MLELWFGGALANPQAKWHTCYIVLSGMHLYILESELSQNYQWCCRLGRGGASLNRCGDRARMQEISSRKSTRGRPKLQRGESTTGRPKLQRRQQLWGRE